MLIISSGFCHHLGKDFYKFSACIDMDGLGLHKGAGGVIVNFCLMCSDKKKIMVVAMVLYTHFQELNIFRVLSKSNIVHFLYFIDMLPISQSNLK